MFSAWGHVPEILLPPLRSTYGNDLITALPERKAITVSLQLHEANVRFGKGFHMLKAHMHANRLMTGRCPCKSLQLRPKFHSLFLQNCFDLKDFNRHLECIDVSSTLKTAPPPK